ncbi:MAG: hypothetical protein LC751_06690 [Actinobacteria bacterium]|nr:hypothetical protein [Actinomycetota bacterium]
MAEGRCRLNRELAREDSLDSSNFPGVLQRSLQREMTEHVEPAPYERAQKRKGHCNEKPRTLKNRPAAPGLSPIEMLWRYFRREVNHCELFARIKMLVTATYDFFDHYNRYSRFFLSIIGSFIPGSVQTYFLYTRNCVTMFSLLNLCVMANGTGISVWGTSGTEQ